MDRRSWDEFLHRELKLRAAEYQQLMSVDDPDETPYKSSYAAAAVQDKLIAAANAFSGQEDLSITVDDVSVPYDTLLCRLHIRKGLALIGTDLLHEAEKSFKGALERAGQLNTPHQDACLQMSALSNMGILYCNRAQFEQALTYLLQAEQLYQSVRRQPSQLDTSRALHTLEGLEEDIDSWFEELYTLALFYMAQVYQQSGQSDKAAEYCAITLGRQLRFGLVEAGKPDDSLDYNNWIQNAAQLSCFFFNAGRFPEAHHILNAADKMLELGKAAGSIAGDVEANVNVAWARYYISRLDMSVARGDPASPSDPASQSLPESLEFPGLDLPGVDTLPWGDAGLATSYDEIRPLFLLCMPHIRSALAFYELDGAVTDHVALLFDGALAYRDLAWFETDPHRRCVMHKHRVKMFSAVDGTLSFQHYPGLVRSIILECANAFRDIFDVKAAKQWPEAKVHASAMEATTHYSRLFDTFREEGDLPDKIDEDWERTLLTACVTQARIHTKSAGSNRQILNRGQALLKYVANYTSNNTVADFAEETALCTELSSLVAQKLSLLEATQPSRSLTEVPVKEVHAVLH